MGEHNHCFHLIRCVCPIGVATQTVNIVFVKGGEGPFLPGSWRGRGSWAYSPVRLDFPFSVGSSSSLKVITSFLTKVRIRREERVGVRQASALFPWCASLAWG